MALDRFRAVCFAALLLLAQGGMIWPGQALAQPAMYTASGIMVDVTGDIATLRDQAMLQGQRQALQQILNEIAPAGDVAGLALPGDDVISSWVQDFSIDQEKVAADRYIGRFTFRFQAEPIRTMLTDNGIAFAQSQQRAVLVVPVMTDEAGASVLWGPANHWLAAWSAARPTTTLLRLVVPAGDPGDEMMLSAVDALAGDNRRLTALAQRHGADDVAVAEAALLPVAPDGTRTLSIAVRRTGGAETLRDQVIGDALAEGELMRLGVERAAALLQQSWKDANLVDAGIQGEIAVDIPVVDLKEWVAVKRQLAKVQGLRGARLVSLTRSLAEMELSHIGTEEQFVRALADQGLALTLYGQGEGTLKLDSEASALLSAPMAEPVPAASEQASPPVTPSDQPAVPGDPAVIPQ